MGIQSPITERWLRRGFERLTASIARAAMLGMSYLLAGQPPPQVDHGEANPL